MKFISTFLLFVLMLSCADKSEKKMIVFETSKPNSISTHKIVVDTLKSSYPVQIGNDKGLIKILGIKTYEGKKLTSSNFYISLNDIPKFTLYKQIDKNVLIDSNETVFLKDTVNYDYLNSALIKNMEFDFVRANTLYFNATLENPIVGKEIIGRFNLFYRTKKKGMVYGWITDDVK